MKVFKLEVSAIATFAFASIKLMFSTKIFISLVVNILFAMRVESILIDSILDFIETLFSLTQTFSII